MLIGLCWFGKSYPPRDYLVVLLLVLGLYVFMNGDAKASPKGTGYGIFLVTLSMFGSAGVPMVQEHWYEAGDMCWCVDDACMCCVRGWWTMPCRAVI